MLEVSAASSPALATAGAVLAAAPAVASGEGAQIADFSALLSSAAGQIEATVPAQVVDINALTALPASAPAPQDAALPTGKTGTIGKLAGKILPPGKLPAADSPAVADKAPRRTTSEDAAPEEEDAVAATSEALPDGAIATTVTVAAAAITPLSTVLPARENGRALPGASSEQGEAAPVTPARNAGRPTLDQGRRLVSTLERKGTPAFLNSARSIAAPEVSIRAIPADQLSEQPAVETLPRRALAAVVEGVAVATPLNATLPASTLPGMAALTATVLQVNSPGASLEATPTSAPNIASPAPLATTGEAIAQQAADTASVGVAAPLEKAPATARTKPQPAPAKLVQLSATTTPAPSVTSDAVDRRSEAAIQLPSYKDALAAAPSAVAASDHKAAPLAPVEAPVALQNSEPAAQVVSADIRSAPLPMVPTAAAPSPATTPTQDVAALIDRITEARAAAAPHVVRAALVHEDFGSVSLNFRTEASHIHVTLGSADPGFAPAVQAAAAASLAADTARDDTGNRRDAPPPPPTAQAQDTATRNDASAQQQAARDRAPAGERQTQRAALGRPGQDSSTETTSSAPPPRRRGGIYA